MNFSDKLSFARKISVLAFSFRYYFVGLILLLFLIDGYSQNKSGYFTDNRDGQKYKWVKIDNKIWMAQNLNFEAAEESSCFNNRPSNCKQYGRMYTYNAAQTACPQGWHMPNRRDYLSLLAFNGYDAEKTVNKITRNDSLSLNILLKGCNSYWSDSKLWTSSSSEYDGELAYGMEISEDRFFIADDLSKHEECYVRCINDETASEIDHDNCFFHSFIAKLKPGLKEYDATFNDNITFKAKAGQLFIYYWDNGNAFIADGRDGFIPAENVVKVETTYFKLNNSKIFFNFDENDDLIKSTKTRNIDINKLTDKVINYRDTAALKKLFDLNIVMKNNATVSEVLAGLVFQLMNLWTDQEISGYYTHLKIKDQKLFADFLLSKDNTYPIECPKEYYKLYYPGLLKLISDTQ